MYELFHDNKKIMQSTKLKYIMYKINNIQKSIKNSYSFIRSWCEDEHTVIIDYGSHTKFFKIINKELNLIDEWPKYFIEHKE